MKFSAEFIERVASANNLVDIISQYTQLKPAGGGLMGRCPFPDHQEKTASFSISESKQLYYCFGCQKKGNIFIFLESYSGMSFPEAVEYLASRANISLPTVDQEQSEKMDQITAKKRLILQVNKLAVEFFRTQFKDLEKNHPAKIYAEKRGLTPELIEIFKIGYAPGEWDGLIQALTKKGISLELMEEAKLIKARSTGNGYFDLFRERIIFPIFDTKNEPIAFGGRILGSGEVKYLNSPETLVFSKSRTLYGLSETSKYIRTEEQAIVVEGYMDLIALYKAGIKNVVAPMGTALTHDQAKMLRRQTQNVVVLFDGDDAGQNAAEKSLPILLEADIHPKGLTLPDQLDPDEFINKQGAEALKKALVESPDLFSLTLSKWLKDYRGEASQKVHLADRLKPLFAAIADKRLKDLYLEESATSLGVDARWLRSALVDGNNPSTLRSKEISKSQTIEQVGGLSDPKTEKTASDIEDKIILKGATQAETFVMAIAIKNRANFSDFLGSEVMEKILHPGIKKVLERASLVYGQDLEKFDRLTSLLTIFVDEPEMLYVSGPLATATEETKLMQDCIIRVRERHFKYQAHMIAQELKSQAPGSSPVDSAKLEQFMNIQRERLALRRLKETDPTAKEDPSELD